MNESRQLTDLAALLLGTDQDWAADALCAETDPDAFFPTTGGSLAPAQRICRRCPVSTQCLTYSLDHRERFGVWGGTSEQDRRRLRHRPPCPQDT